MPGFEYLQQVPFERFRVPDQTHPIDAAALLLSFAAYPQVGQLLERQRTTDAYRAWIIRQSIRCGVKITPPAALNRKSLPPQYVRRRVYRAARRFEIEGLDMVEIGLELSFRRIDGYSLLARALAAHFKASSTTVTVPRTFNSEASVFREYLTHRKASSALCSEATTLKDFRRRVWKVYLPALPLLTAIHMDCLKYNVEEDDYDVKLPGHGRRSLAISLISNPQAWVSSVVQHAKLRRLMMAERFAENAFAEILPEHGPGAD